MRARTRAFAAAALMLAVAAPAAARHWHGGFRWGFGIGPVWWGPWWGAPAWYEPGPGVAVQSDLAAVDTDVSPEHARVILNGQLVGVADDFDGYPGYLLLKPGHYTIEFSLKGYRSERIEIDARPGQYYPVDLKLERVPGEKPAPWYDRPEGLPVSRVFGPKGGVSASAGATGPDPSLRPELRAQPATPRGAPTAARSAGAALELRVTPPNAAIYVDGRFVGTGDELGRLERGLAVAPGKHRIEVVAPGLPAKTVEVEVPDGQRQQVVVELEGGTGQT